MHDEVSKLRQDNAKLKKKVANLESQLEQARNKFDKASVKHEREILKLEQRNFRHEQNEAALKAEVEKWKKAPNHSQLLLLRQALKTRRPIRVSFGYPLIKSGPVFVENVLSCIMPRKQDMPRSYNSSVSRG